MKLFCLSVICFLCSFLKAQELQQKICFLGEKSDMLDYLDATDSDNNIMQVLTYSSTGDFYDPQPVQYRPYTWLINFDENYDTIWKKRLPNSNYSEYYVLMPIPFSGCWLISKPYGLDHKSFTAFEDELAVYYLTRDTLTRQYYLHFNIWDKATGNDKIHPFCIDTINTIEDDEYEMIRSASCIKVNDSIYQLFCDYHFFAGGYCSWFYPRYAIYTINIRTGDTKKYANEFYYLSIPTDTENYILTGTYDTLTELFLCKLYTLDQNGAFTDSILYFDEYGFGHYYTILGSRLLIYKDFGYILINLDTKAVSKHSLPGYYIYQSQLNGEFPISHYSGFYPSFSVWDKNIPYAFIMHEEDIPGVVGDPGIVKFKENGLVDTIIKMNVPPLEENEDLDVYSFQTSTSVGEVFVTYFHANIYDSIPYDKFVMQAHNADLQRIWALQIPDTASYNDNIYKFSEVENISKLQHSDNIILVAKYYFSGNTRNYLSKYLQIDLLTGAVKELDLPSFNSWTTLFLDNERSDLYIINNGTSLCGDTTRGDISVHRYGMPTSVVSTYSQPEKLFIYPNPATNIVTLSNPEFNTGDDLHISMYDMTGKLVFEQFHTGTNHNVQLDVSGLNNGIYVVRAMTEGKYYTQKLIIY